MSKNGILILAMFCFAQSTVCSFDIRSLLSRDTPPMAPVFSPMSPASSASSPSFTHQPSTGWFSSLPSRDMMYNALIVSAALAGGGLLGWRYWKRQQQLREQNRGRSALPLPAPSAPELPPPPSYQEAIQASGPVASSTPPSDVQQRSPSPPPSAAPQQPVAQTFKGIVIPSDMTYEQFKDAERLQKELDLQRVQQISGQQNPVAASSGSQRRSSTSGVQPPNQKQSSPTYKFGRYTYNNIIVVPKTKEEQESMEQFLRAAEAIDKKKAEEIKDKEKAEKKLYLDKWNQLKQEVEKEGALESIYIKRHPFLENDEEFKQRKLNIAVLQLLIRNQNAQPQQPIIVPLGIDLSGIKLEENSNLQGAELQANLSGAQLRKANLAGAKLTSALLTKADLSGADLTGADLLDADLRDAQLFNVLMDEKTNLHHANLKNVQGLTLAQKQQARDQEAFNVPD